MEQMGKWEKPEVGNGWHRECAYAYFWESVPGVGAKSIERCYLQYGSYQKMYEQNGKKGLTEKQQAECRRQKCVWNIKEEYGKLLANKIWCIPKQLQGYPDRLLRIEQAPSALFVRGKLPGPGHLSVAIVGARRCSPYGSTMARELAKRMAAKGIQVISGLASGIDGISQRGALEGNGATFGIMGCGVDICYPEENRDIFTRLCNGENGGGIISEYMPGTQPAAGRFPMRNRIISGLADVLVVVEAKEKSGTFITVSSALEQGKDVYVFPGRLGDRLSYGCNRLIAQGAGIIYDMDEFIVEILAGKHMIIEGSAGKGEISGSGEEKELQENAGEQKGTGYDGECGQMNKTEQEILEVLEIQYQSVEEIMDRMIHREKMTDVLAALSTLECMGMVEMEGSFYRKKEKFV